MLSGAKFIPRNQLDEGDEGKDTRKKSSNKKIHRSELSSDDKSMSSRRSQSHSEWCSSKESSSIRKEMGLDWMQRDAYDCKTTPAAVVSKSPEKLIAEEQQPKVNPRELNPYLKNNGSGYPDDVANKSDCGDALASSSVVGDGGASWRMKALKRAKEQATREGRRLDEVVEDRWGSLGHLTVSAASSGAAPAHAHLHAIRHRRKKVMNESRTLDDSEHESNLRQNSSQKSMTRHHGMKEPKVYDSLSWGKKKGNDLSVANDSLLLDAVASINKFADDGSFMSSFLKQEEVKSGVSVCSSTGKSRLDVVQIEEKKVMTGGTQNMRANQLAAKALQLRMKGRHEDAEKLMQQATSVDAQAPLTKERTMRRNTNTTPVISFSGRDVSVHKAEDDADKNLAERIMKNRKYSTSSQADDEYDYDVAPSKKSKRKIDRDNDKATARNSNARRFMTQKERCVFCFENPHRPKHLVLSIANFTYLMLPQSQPVVPGHCCILPLQHESSARCVDNDVWEEMRNFKKCLIMMFSKQEKEMVFLETVFDLAKQRRHCMIECIPLSRDVARQAPLYFKKAIDEAEDEWSQHNAKKLIDTSEKGLRGSIPKDFPYFHVEFGLNRGFVHVIDDENNFNSHLGLNVIRGMLRLPEEDMYRNRRRQSLDIQVEAVSNFMRDWQHFDWTKQLH